MDPGPFLILIIQSTAIHCSFPFTTSKHHFLHCASNPLFSARPVRLTTSLFHWGKPDCLSVCRFHVVADAGSAPCHKSASNNLQKCSLPPTGPIKPWFLTEGKLLLCYILPSSWVLSMDVWVYTPSSSFLAPLLGRKRISVRGVSHSQSRCFVFLSCLV